jgi:hypothetical protein
MMADDSGRSRTNKGMSAPDGLRRVGGYLCAGYGALLLCVGIYGVSYDMKRGGLNATSFMVVIPAIMVLFAALGAFRRMRAWPIAALVGNILVLALVVRVTNGSPFTLLHSSMAPIGLFVVLLPMVIVMISIAALVKGREAAGQ